MPKRTAEAEWKGNLEQGKGSIIIHGENRPYSFSSRFEEEGTDTNPEELIGAAHAGCFSMALSHKLAKAGFKPARIHTKADVHLDKVGEGFQITRIDLDTEADVPGIDSPTFRAYAQDAKDNCPVSKALAGVRISLQTRLLSGNPAHF